MYELLDLLNFVLIKYYRRCNTISNLYAQMNSIFGVFFGYQKDNEQEQIVSTYCPSSQKRKKKKKENNINGTSLEGNTAGKDSLPGLNPVHFILDPSHATNNGKLTVEYYKYMGFQLSMDYLLLSDRGS